MAPSRSISMRTTSPACRIAGRVHRHADARRGAGEDQVAWLERAGLADEGDDLERTPKIRSRVEPSWRSSPLTQVRSDRSLRVGELVGGGDPRPPRAGGVEALGPRPLRLAALEVAGADVVGDRVAGDLAPGAHDHGELALVVEAPDHRRDGQRIARRDRGARELHEDDRRLRRLASGLRGVVAVVQADAEDRPRPRDRRQQPHLGQSVLGALEPGSDRRPPGGPGPSRRRARPPGRRAPRLRAEPHCRARTSPAAWPAIYVRRPRGGGGPASGAPGRRGAR